MEERKKMISIIRQMEINGTMFDSMQCSPHAQNKFLICFYFIRNWLNNIFERVIYDVGSSYNTMSAACTNDMNFI